MGDLIDALPADAEPAALARFAPQINSVLQDADQVLSQSKATWQSEENIADGLISTSREFLSKMSPADPVVAVLREDMEKAARKGKTKDIINASKAIVEYMNTLGPGNP